MKYCSEVLNIGSDVEELISENLMVLFCEEAPEVLYDYCVIHKNKWPYTDFGVGDNFALGNHLYEITALGDAAVKNLNELGHVTLCFDGAVGAQMGGYIHLNGEGAYIPKIGEEIVIF